MYCLLDINTLVDYCPVSGFLICSVGRATVRQFFLCIAARKSFW